MLISVVVTAQVKSVKRVEFDLKDEFYGETIYEFGSEGFVMVSNSKASGGEVSWNMKITMQTWK